MRLFIAIALPEDLRTRLAALATGLPGARWVSEDNLHLSLRFLGELDGGAAADVDAALAGVRAPGFELVLEGVSHFGEGRNLRALWAGVRPSPELKRLQAKIEQAVVRAGQPPEKRKFKPHVTLARFKSNPGAKLQSYLAEHALLRSEPFPVEAFTLYSSFLSASGAIYRAEAEYPLGPSENGGHESGAGPADQP
jgi:2'-5' RNA ligase